MAAMALILIARLAGQSPQATVNGTVVDPQGAFIVAAEVTAVNLQTGVETLAKTNDSGLYSLRFLPVGKYTIKVSHPGFRVHTREGIVLTTGQDLELDIRLEIGAANESVTITANASMLETRTAQMGQLVESRTVEDIPLGD